MVAIAAFILLNLWLRHQMNRTEFTSSTAQLEFTMGTDVLRIPANHVRFEHQRNKTSLDQLDLVFLYSQMSGYSNTHKASFNATGNESRLIHLSLRKRELSYDMTNRLSSVYRQLFEGAPTAGPAGLILQPLRPGSGYDEEVLAIGEYGSQKWVARCQTPQSNVRPTCIRDVFVGRNISALISFPLHMLAEWKAIEKKTLNFLKNSLR